MKDITQIRVGKHTIGITGLKQALEELAAQSHEMADVEIADLLLEKLSKRNYISPGSRDNYRQAFLREFKKERGEPVAEEPADGLQIKVLGAGCARCDRLEREVMDILSENGIVAELEHVRELNEISSYGVMGTPALVINGEVKSVGIVPSRSKIRNWLADAVDS